jgi:hypothetical protein
VAARSRRGSNRQRAEQHTGVERDAVDNAAPQGVDHRHPIIPIDHHDAAVDREDRRRPAQWNLDLRPLDRIGPAKNAYLLMKSRTLEPSWNKPERRFDESATRSPLAIEMAGSNFCAVARAFGSRTVE